RARRPATAARYPPVTQCAPNRRLQRAAIALVRLREFAAHDADVITGVKSKKVFALDTRVVGRLLAPLTPPSVCLAHLHCRGLRCAAGWQRRFPTLPRTIEMKRSISRRNAKRFIPTADAAADIVSPRK